MPDYGLFLKYRFNNDGNFLENNRPRRPDARFWDQVITDAGGNLITVATAVANTRINADTKTMEVTARTHPPVGANPPTDKVYFAVNFAGGGANPVLNKVSFACGLHPGMKVSRSTVASPFRLAAEINCLLTGDTFSRITSTDPFTGAIDAYDAIGPYPLIKDPVAAIGDSCFYKLTLVASATRIAVTREFSYDPDMDVESG